MQTFQSPLNLPFLVGPENRSAQFFSQLADAGFHSAVEPERAIFTAVRTRQGFLDLLELKKQGKLKKVIVAGCLAQRYSQDLVKEFKGIDAIIGAQQVARTL